MVFFDRVQVFVGFKYFLDDKLTDYKFDDKELIVENTILITFDKSSFRTQFMYVSVGWTNSLKIRQTGRS